MLREKSDFFRKEYLIICIIIKINRKIRDIAE